MRRPASLLNNLAMQAEEAGHLTTAIRLYGWACRLSPKWSAPWFNLGLLYKRRRDWPNSLHANHRATELKPDSEAPWWNLGIAATALGNWEVARAAWRGFGLRLPEGSGPIELDFGLTPIRLAAESGEVVWSRRIDPARAIIDNVPLPDSGHCCGDLVLHDGAPNGYRLLHGKEIPVFDELELLQPSRLSTYELRVVVPSSQAIEALEALAEPKGIVVEDWTSSVRLLCRACSEGRPHAHGHDEPVPAWQPDRTIGFAARNARELQPVLDQWIAGEEGVALQGFSCAIHSAGRQGPA